MGDINVAMSDRNNTHTNYDHVQELSDVFNFTNLIKQITCFRAGTNKEPSLRKQKCVKCFWKILKAFLAFKTQISCLQHMLRWGANEESLGNTEETLTLNVSRMFPHLCTQATYLEDAEFASQKQKCFASFPFAHPYNIVNNTDSKRFCSNVSSFAPTFTPTATHPSLIDIILTNRPRSFKNSVAIETGLSDHHKMVLTVLKCHFVRLQPTTIQYKDYKYFSS